MYVQVEDRLGMRVFAGVPEMEAYMRLCQICGERDHEVPPTEANAWPTCVKCSLECRRCGSDCEMNMTVEERLCFVFKRTNCVRCRWQKPKDQYYDPRVFPKCDEKKTGNVQPGISSPSVDSLRAL